METGRLATKWVSWVTQESRLSWLVRHLYSTASLHKNKGHHTALSTESREKWIMFRLADMLNNHELNTFCDLCSPVCPGLGGRWELQKVWYSDPTSNMIKHCSPANCQEKCWSPWAPAECLMWCYIKLHHLLTDFLPRLRPGLGRPRSPSHGQPGAK